MLDFTQKHWSHNTHPALLCIKNHKRSKHSRVDDRNILNEILLEDKLPNSSTNASKYQPRIFRHGVFYLQPFHFASLTLTNEVHHSFMIHLQSTKSTTLLATLLQIFLVDDRRIYREYYMQPRRGYHDHKPSTTSPASNNGKAPANT